MSFIKNQLVLIFCFLSLGAFAQQEPCGSFIYLKQQMQNDPVLRAAYEAHKVDMQDYQHAGSSRSVSNIVYVPVVFHVIHNGQAVGTDENISDAQVLSQIDAMNEDFSLTSFNVPNIPAAFKPFAANTHIQFCLAKFDPSGNPTTGIDRINMHQTGWDSQNSIDRTLKPATTWGDVNYLNIWTFNPLPGGAIDTTGILAYAQFPFQGRANTDGVAVRYNCVGRVGNLLSGYSKGKTISHETGHWLGLFHTWGDDNGACTGSDNINDTPNQADHNFSCPNFPHTDACTPTAPGVMYMNYMDYTDDFCRNMFTVDQAAEMNGVLDNTRASIKNNSLTKCYYNVDAALLNIIHPIDSVCRLNFNPLVSVKNAGATQISNLRFVIQVDGATVNTYSWSGSLGIQETQLISLPAVTTTAGSHTLGINISNVNVNQTDNNLTNNSTSVTFYAYDAGIGVNTPLAEGFESGVYPPASWTIINPNNNNTWQLDGSTGAYGNSNLCTSIDNFHNATNRQVDAFITDYYSYANQTPTLKFDVAYARRSATRSDTLTVFYSLNCGTIWNQVWQQGGSDLATAPDTTGAFSPTSTQWKTVTVDISALANQDRVGFKFQNTAGLGNMLYLDNINVTTSAISGVAAVEDKIKVLITPNPVTTNFSIRLPQNHGFTEFEIYNNIGEVVYKKTMNEETFYLVDVSSLAAGLYVIRLNGTEHVQTERLLVIK